ncbi:MAG: 30S ribosome-binding factor RbfA, partial [Endomicrobium sp.]|nr:30S ribosome-binding factor RbfA [Endomicrobium sp.]
MPLLYKRSTRVCKLIHKVLVKIIIKVKNLDTSIITITDVKLTDDLMNCKVYYSVFGTMNDVEKINKILKKNIKNIRYQLATHLSLRRIPLISFVYDNTN